MHEGAKLGSLLQSKAEGALPQRNLGRVGAALAPSDKLQERTEGRGAECEAVILRAQGIPASADLRPPTGIRLRGSRRALRVPLGEFRGDFEGEALRLRFELPAGSYATVLVEEIVGAFDEAR